MPGHPFPREASLDGYQSISGSCSAEERVQLLTGNLLATVRVVDVPTVGLPLRVYLTYNHQDSLAGVMGNNWRHNYMMNLEFGGDPVNVVTFVSDTGRRFDFIPDGGSGWVLDDSTSSFLGCTLTESDDVWRLTYPNGSYFQFDGDGKIVSMVDRHGNATTLAYDSGLLVSVTEPTGRAIGFTYTGGLLSSIIHPKSTISVPVVTTLLYTGQNLTQIVGPEGCVTGYGYDTATPNRVVSRTDALYHTFSFAYDTSNRLSLVTDPADHTLSYAYDTVMEYPGLYTGLSLQRTVLHDAMGHDWEFRFDQGGNLWRIIDPQGHEQHNRWGGQKLVYQSEPFPPTTSSRDNLNNTVRRHAFNLAGDLLYSQDGGGLVDAFTYDEKRNRLSEFPAQANLAVQGNWVGQYGSDGHVLCGMDPGSPPTDRATLPSYVSAITAGTNPFVRRNATGTRPLQAMDPRAPVAADGLQRSLGSWGEDTASGFDFQVGLTEACSFNLSIYTHSSDQGYADDSFVAPLTYAEQFGREMEFTVTDANGQQSFHVYNNAPGVWITFPVTGDAENPVQVTVTATGVNAESLPNTEARISVVAFDPFENRRTSYGYNGTSDLVTVTDGLGQQTVMGYAEDGTLSTVTNPLSQVTSLYHEDDHRNLTRIVDAMSPTPGERQMTYDLHGNVLTMLNENLHQWGCEYDLKDRPVRFTDPLDNETLLEYDAAGNMIQVTNARGKVTQIFFDANNRPWKIQDALDQVTLMAYDASGNMISVTDPLERETLFGFDSLNRLIQITRPDGTIVTRSYDGQGRLRAVTPPNGHVEASEINLLGAFNHLRNPGFEQPFSWFDGSGPPVRRSSFAHSGGFGLVNEGGTTAGTTVQNNIPIGPGARALATGWAAMAGIPDHWFGAVFTVFTRTLQGGVSGPSATRAVQPPEGWVPLPPVVFDIPGDAQYDVSPVPQVRYSGSSTGIETFHGDDFQLYSLSTTLDYDRAGRILGAQAPDGAFQGVRRDRCGRVVQVVDSNGQAWSIFHDALGRPVRVVGPEQEEGLFGYDAVSNLIRFQDSRGNLTQYAYDANNRLLSITYPDSTTELFGYDAAGNLVSHTNNRGQERTFSYDAAERLVGVTYETDDSEFTFVLDEMGNVVEMVDRNGDVTASTYDDLDRLTNETRSSASEAPIWSFDATYDAAGNRTSLSTPRTVARYGTARYGQTTYAEKALLWSVPIGGYDEVDRMVLCEDASQNQTGFTHDVDGNRTGIAHANNLATTVGHDIVGKVLSLRVTQPGEEGGHLLAMDHGYDRAGNRLATVVGNDTSDYAVDRGGQLVEERINQFVEKRVEDFQRGTPSGLVLEETPPGISLLDFDDTFGGSDIQSDRWHLGCSPQEFAGLEIRQQDGLHMVFPAGYTSLIFGTAAITDHTYGLRTDTIFASLANRVQVSGDFDVQVEFSDFFGATNPTTGNYVKVGLQVEDAFFEATPENRALISRIVTNQTTSAYQVDILNDGTPLTPAPTASTADTAGKFRITRVDTTLSLYYWSGSTWVLLGSDESFSTGSLYVALHFEAWTALGGIRFTNLALSESSNQYGSTGTYTSGVYDVGRPNAGDSADSRTVTWDTLSWQASTPTGTSVAFQVATSDVVAPSSWTFVGPDGTSGSSFTTSPASLPTVLNGSNDQNRYVRYQATLTGDGTATPTVTDVRVAYSGDTSSRLTSYGYDSAGNMISKVVETATGTSTEIRDDESWTSADRINNLNQILRNDITPAGESTATWRYTYDASGNLTSKSNGTDTWLYTWNEDNRLVLVTRPDETTMAYTYDAFGRMLTRTHSVDDTRTFQWDGWDCVREVGPDNVATRWMAPQGELLWFERRGVRYEVHSDALASVRMVTGPDGTVLARFNYDAWGNLLDSSFDNVPGGCPWAFVGALGVRWDAWTGLYYMRQRWYDPGLGRFISRDPIVTTNLYSYVGNRPSKYIDPEGLWTPEGVLTVLSTMNECNDIGGWCKNKGITILDYSTPEGQRFYQAHPSPVGPPRLGGGMSFVAERVILINAPPMVRGHYTNGSQFYAYFDDLNVAVVVAHELSHHRSRRYRTHKQAFLDEVTSFKCMFEVLSAIKAMNPASPTNPITNDSIFANLEMRDGTAQFRSRASRQEFIDELLRRYPYIRVNRTTLEEY